MRTQFKELLVQVGGRLSPRTIHNLNASINYLEVGRWMHHRSFKPIHTVTTKGDFWRILDQEVGDRVVLYLEFGVWRGDTTRLVARHLHNRLSTLHGFDSFQGLPENWNIGADAGCFSTNGIVPAIDDPRIKFHKGWFQETLPSFVMPPHETLVINLDADLYSSTSYVLGHLQKAIIPGTYVYFDEFSDRHHEMRAFDEFLNRSALKFGLVAATPALDKVMFRCQ